MFTKIMTKKHMRNQRVLTSINPKARLPRFFESHRWGAVTARWFEDNDIIPGTRTTSPELYIKCAVYKIPPPALSLAEARPTRRPGPFGPAFAPT